MALSYEDVLQILKIIEQSHFDYLELQTDQFKLVVQKGAGPSPTSGRNPEGHPSFSAQVATTHPDSRTGTSAPTLVGSKETMVVHVSEAATQRALGEDEASGATSSAGLAAAREGTVPIKAPMPGHFYVAPEPGAPPFVEVGSAVGPDTTVGLIEVMKVFSAVKAGVQGTIVERLVENGQFVEYGQPLFLVRPEPQST